MPACLQTLLRTISGPVAADPDWEATQVPPDPSICIDLTGLMDGSCPDQIGIVALADTGGVTVAGTVTIQPIDVAPSRDPDRPQIVVGGFHEIDVPTGREVLIPVGYLVRFTIRLVGANAPVLAADQLKIYWRRIS